MIWILGKRVFFLVTILDSKDYCKFGVGKKYFCYIIMLIEIIGLRNKGGFIMILFEFEIRLFVDLVVYELINFFSVLIY